MTEDSLMNWLDHLEESVLDRLPKTLQQEVRDMVKRIRESINPERPPRFALVGRRGSGKSSLLNALFGEKVAEVGATTSQTGRGVWHTFESTGGQLEILDTRGIGEGSTPTEEVDTDSPTDEIQRALHEKEPDAILFLTKAKEVDSRIDEDIAGLKTLTTFIEGRHAYSVPLVGIITQVDELDPVDVSEPPFEDEEKQANIQEVVKCLEKRMQDEFAQWVCAVIPTCAYMRYKDERVVVDRRWHIDELLGFLVDNLPETYQVQLCRISRRAALQKKVARAIGKKTALVAAGIALVPIPLSDILPITGLQIGMVAIIASLAGFPPSKDTAKDFLGALGVSVAGGMGMRTLARQLTKFIPVASSGIAYAGTIGLCEAAIVYFIDGKSANEAQVAYEYSKSEAEEEGYEETS